MKRIKMLAILFLIGTMGIFAQKSLTTMTTAMVECAEVVQEVEDDLDMEIVHIQFDLVTNTEWKWTYRDLHKGWTYVIYAAGEYVKVADLDIKLKQLNIYTNEWEEVAEDVTSDFSGVVGVSPPITGRYAIGIKVAEFEDGYNNTHYYILIAHE